MFTVAAAGCRRSLPESRQILFWSIAGREGMAFYGVARTGKRAGGVAYALNDWAGRIDGLDVNISNDRFNNTGVALGASGGRVATSIVLRLANGNRNNNAIGLVRAAVNFKFGTYQVAGRHGVCL
ncbi:hypothetical protein ACRAWG_26165 [Methylobacterium sp. P31]